MHVLLFLAFGVGIGLIAHRTVPGREPRGALSSIVIGMLGAVGGGFLGRALGLYEQGRAAGFLMAAAGAILLLVVYRVNSSRGDTTRAVSA
jgi:uncharacterized membrane protein YeaQ/YmgE (transglycosylase-associated protein family)